MKGAMKMSKTNTIDALGDDVALAKLIDRSIAEFIDDTVKTVGQYAFYKCQDLENVEMPAVTTIESYAFASCINLLSVSMENAQGRLNGYAFQGCTQLVSFSLPRITSIENSAFSGCKELTNATFPSIATVGQSAFNGCTKLSKVSLPLASSIGSASFANCALLTTVIIGNTSRVATLTNSSAFVNAPNAVIYVPDALVDSYKSATNWSTYADRIKGISELPEE